MFLVECKSNVAEKFNQLGPEDNQAEAIKLLIWRYDQHYKYYKISRWDNLYDYTPGQLVEGLLDLVRKGGPAERDEEVRVIPDRDKGAIVALVANVLPVFKDENIFGAYVAKRLIECGQVEAVRRNPESFQKNVAKEALKDYDKNVSRGLAHQACMADLEPNLPE